MKLSSVIIIGHNLIASLVSAKNVLGLGLAFTFWHLQNKYEKSAFYLLLLLQVVGQTRPVFDLAQNLCASIPQAESRHFKLNNVKTGISFRWCILWLPVYSLFT